MKISIDNEYGEAETVAGTPGEIRHVYQDPYTNGIELQLDNALIALTGEEVRRLYSVLDKLHLKETI